jgi:hypothetical protein
MATRSDWVKCFRRSGIFICTAVEIRQYLTKFCLSADDFLPIGLHFVKCRFGDLECREAVIAATASATPADRLMNANVTWPAIDNFGDPLRAVRAMDPVAVISLRASYHHACPVAIASQTDPIATHPMAMSSHSPKVRRWDRGGVGGRSGWMGWKFLISRPSHRRASD